MKRKLRIPPPFFEIGPKNYLYGKDIIELAKIAERASLRHNVEVIFTTPYVNINEVSAKTEHIHIFAPHIDCAPIGRGLANVLPESVRQAGATGVMLNHTEKQLSVAELISTIERAKGLDMMTIICATSIAETCAVAALHPDMIVSEPLELIGTGNAVGECFVRSAMDCVFKTDPNIGVLVAAGVHNGEDVYRIIRAGADATGSSSAIALAREPERVVDEMLEAARCAWDERVAEKQKKSNGRENYTSQLVDAL